MVLLFVTASPINKMHFNDMYIDALKDEFETRVWDISGIRGAKNENGDYPEVLRINSYTELEDELDKIDDRIVVITNILIYDLHNTYRFFHKRRIPLVSIDKESIIFWMRDNYLKKHPQYAKKQELSKFFWKSNPLTRSIYSYLEYQHVKFDYILGSNNYFPDASKHFVKIHSLKYDEYLKSKEETPVVEGKYILFMDAGLAHLPNVVGKPNSIDQKDYLNCLNSIFDELEKRYDMPVIVAAHPKSGYQDSDFDGRQIILYKTPALLKYSEFVIAHYSTSLIDLVLQKKPVIFLNCEEYMNSPSQTILITASEYARMLNAPLVDIKDHGEIKINFDEAAYDRFIGEHILLSGNENSTNKELIMDFLKGICD